MSRKQNVSSMAKYSFSESIRRQEPPGTVIYTMKLKYPNVHKMYFDKGCVCDCIKYIGRVDASIYSQYLGQYCKAQSHNCCCKWMDQCRAAKHCCLCKGNTRDSSCKVHSICCCIIL